MKVFSPRKLAVALVIASSAYLSSASAVMTTFYYDAFTRSGYLQASTPTITTSTNSWMFTYGDFGISGTTYVTTGSTAAQAPLGGSGPFDGSSYLPVNGSSGVMLDGTSDFTLSVVVSQGGQTTMGIGLNTTTYAGGSMYGSDGSPEYLTIFGLNDGNTFLSYYSGTNNGIAFAGWPDNTPVTLSISYNATADTLTYRYNNTLMSTQTGVTEADISSLRYVSIANSSFANNSGYYDDFTLAIDVVPEPSTCAALLVGVGALAASYRKRERGKSRSLTNGPPDES